MTPQSFDAALARARQLVADFGRDEANFLSPKYSEIDVRNDFINRFWQALGWDVTHETQKNPYEREVVIESSVNVEGRGKRADYAFYVTPNFRAPRFLVEAKKPSRKIENADDYFQTIRYGWSSKTPVAALTNFEQLHLLDCRYVPNITDALDRSLEKYHYTDFTDAEKFREIYHLFGREAVADGALERYAAALPKHTGKARARTLFRMGRYQSVDESFLEKLDAYRAALADSFKRRNARLNGEELTELTQRTLDRLVFMRFLEDKLIEQEPLVENFGARSTAWRDFLSASERLDKIYNGIIFKPHALLDAPEFQVDEAIFESICDELAHVNTPYDFNYIPIHILGSIYERFLGKTITVAGASARVEDKPEVRKAGGVYYTPEYIVRYIVENTVGRLIKGKTPEEIGAMRFADIACGSGSFLLGIFDALLRYHTSYYNASKRRRGQGLKAGCLPLEDGTLRLSLLQKRDILLNNVYGVDLDAQAVEVAQLSLYLKLLEDETTASAKNYQLSFRAAMLPSLDRNIVNGNALISHDILASPLFDQALEHRLNPLTFEETFRPILKSGGFDAIVGNPPWLMAGYYMPESLDYLRSNFQTAKGKFDLYYLFIEQGCRLVSPDGMFGMIVPNKFFHTRAAAKLREFLSAAKWIRRIVDFGDEQIFAGATNYSCCLFLQKQEGANPLYIKATEGLFVTDEFEAPWSVFAKETWHFEDERKRALFEKMEESGTPLEQMTARFGTGAQSGADSLLTMPDATARELRLEPQILRPIFRGRDVRAYATSPAPKLLLFPYKEQDGEFITLSEQELRKFPNAYKFLLDNQQRLARRVWFDKGAEELSGQWYGMMYLDSRAAFAAPHLLTPALSNRSNFALGTGDIFATGTAGVTSIIPVAGIGEHILYLLGLLNSAPLSYYATGHSPIFSGGYHKFSAPYLKKLPIRRINFTDPADHARHDRMVRLVEQMLTAKRQLSGAQTDYDRNLYDRKRAALESQINQLACELYALTDEEIALLEIATA
jgi:adenine-specific DNA-methyltransferase